MLLLFETLQGDVVLPSHFSRLGNDKESEDLRPKLASTDVDARVVGLSAFLENPARALQSAMPSKAPSRRSARLSVIGRALGNNSLPPRECSPSLAALAESLALAAGLLKRAATAPWKVQPPSQLSKVADCLDFSSTLLRELPHPCAEPGTFSEAETRDEFYNFLETLLCKLRDVAENPGSLVILPCAPPASARSPVHPCFLGIAYTYRDTNLICLGGWLRRRVSAASLSDDLGHCVLLVLSRSSDLSKEEFILGVVNSGEGLQYHPASLSRSQPNPEMPLRQSPLILTGIPMERVCSSALWYLLYRQILHPDPENGAMLSVEV